MRRLAVLLLLVPLLLAGCGAGAALRAARSMRDQAKPAETPVAAARTDREVSYGSDKAQRIDVYVPAAAAHAPVILMVHGGGWRRGDKTMQGVVTNKAAHVLPRGYVFVSVETRLVPDADPLEQARDVARALAFVQQNAARWNIDPTRAVLMGHSAGAHLVALLGADMSIATSLGAQPWRGTIAIDSGGYDVARIMTNRRYGLYDTAFGKDPALWHAASPIERVRGTPAPMLLVCSTTRPDDSCGQARAFAAHLSAAGARAELLPQALSHLDINTQLGLPGAYTDAVDLFLKSLGLP
jgi:arylformamidase